jgi:toxin FitB
MLDFEDRILPFDEAAARQHAVLAAKARANGRGFPTADSCIAAIASTHDLAVATRDAAPFLAAGVRVVDPWAG